MFEYRCYQETSAGVEEWSGCIEQLIEHNSYNEMLVTGRGTSLWVVFGKYRHGNFLCIPNANIGCELASLGDTFWNTERLSELAGSVDATTIAYGLKAVSQLL